MDVDVVKEFGSLGVLGSLLGIVLVYIFKFWLPKRDEMFTESLRVQRETFERLLVSEHTLFKSGLEALASRQRKSSENIGEALKSMSQISQSLEQRGREHEKQHAILEGVLEESKSHHRTEEDWLQKIEKHMQKVANGAGAA